MEAHFINKGAVFPLPENHPMVVGRADDAEQKCKLFFRCIVSASKRIENFVDLSFRGMILLSSHICDVIDEIIIEQMQSLVATVIREADPIFDPRRVRFEE